MFVFFKMMRVVSQTYWFARRRRALKLEQMERRLLDYKLPEYKPRRKRVESGKRIPATTC